MVHIAVLPMNEVNKELFPMQNDNHSGEGQNTFGSVDIHFSPDISCNPTDYTFICVIIDRDVHQCF